VNAGARAPRIALVAGEASGDLLGAGLIARLRERFPAAEFAGIGGPQMREAGFDAWHDCSELAVMGLTEVLRHLPRLLRLRRATRERLLAWKPDVFIGIDAPDFNLGLERRLKSQGIRTVHYVSPSVWAWRESRAAKIGRSADRVLCLFPMEPPIYAQHGVDARFVGHPLADALPLEPDRAAARAALELPLDALVLALLPGSRLGEIKRLALDFVGAAMLLLTQFPNLRVVAPMANAACRQAFLAHLDGAFEKQPGLRDRVQVIDGQAHQAMIAADVVLLASGTATLEALLAKRPMVVAYRISALTYAIVRGFGLMKTDAYSLPNALAGERVVPELMQDDCTAENLAREILAWLHDPARMAALQPRFEAIHRELRRDASERAADAVAELIAMPRTGAGIE
jgi:lipid-A-disaccharide synthase